MRSARGGAGSARVRTGRARTRSLFSAEAWTEARSVLERRSRRVLVALDVDGTIAPIVRRPESVRVPRETLGLLERAAGLSRVRVALVSARSLRDLRRLAPARGVARVGQYGLEGPAAPPAAARRRWRKRAARLLARLEPVVAPFRGAWIEGKGLSVAIHDRGVSPDRREALRRALRSVRREAMALGFGVALGRRVTDFVPAGYHKGRALREVRLRIRPDVVFYFGDTASDEPAFAMLPPGDFSVRVGPGSTTARYRVRGPREVTRFLRALVRLRADARRT